MKFLVIQNAFIGDVILATAVAEKLYQNYPASKIDFLLRKGNEELFKKHPFIHEVIVWDKKNGKYKNLFRILTKVRGAKYDYIINLHRFGSSGFITAFSGSKYKIGFDKNPFSFLFTRKIIHEIGNGKHETERNHLLIKDLTDSQIGKPKLYPSKEDYEISAKISGQQPNSPYICIAPTSVWFTKQFPKEKWVELINTLDNSLKVYLLGASNDFSACEEIRNGVINKEPEKIMNLAGKLSLLQTAALMKQAKMNYVNDSAPMHIASAMNAPVTAVFCSTIPSFGFGPLSYHSTIVETKEKLDCRPCGLHGYKICPKGHYQCALSIEIKNII